MISQKAHHDAGIDLQHPSTLRGSETLRRLLNRHKRLSSAASDPDEGAASALPGPSSQGTEAT